MVPVTGSGVRVGIDLVAADDVRASMDRFGERYLARLFTSAERAYCDSSPERADARYAARFAAKEAVRKVLRPSGGLEFRDVEVVRDADGAPRIELHGATRRRAEELGLGGWSVSLTHEGGLGGAVVVATQVASGCEPEGQR